MIDLVPIFDSLQLQPDVKDGLRFVAQRLTGYAGYRVAKTGDGAPAILVAALPVQTQRANPIAIEHLVVQHDVECSIASPDGDVELGKYSLLRCRGEERSLHIYFLRVVSALIAILGPTPTQNDVASGVTKLVELFRVMTEPSRKSVQGLWAELYVIARSKDPVCLVQSWHAIPADLYDFGLEGQRIEVKSTVSGVRKHHFTMEQLNPPFGVRVLVISLGVSQVVTGESIMDLVERIRRRMPNDFDLLLRIDAIIAQTLGENWRAAVEDRFDWDVAARTAAFFDVAEIPGIRTELPTGVTSVSFVSDLTRVLPTDLREFHRSGRLWRALGTLA
jgi:hypothetical protein